MAQTNEIKIYYGPYFSNGLLQHKIQRLYGLFQALNKLKFDIELIPTNLINRLSIELCDMEIFTCDIRNLKFNIECEHDVVCSRAIKAVIEMRDTILERKDLKNHSVFDEDVTLLYEISINENERASQGSHENERASKPNIEFQSNYIEYDYPKLELE